MSTYHTLYEQLTARLRAVRTKELTLSATSGLMLVGACSLAILLLFTAFEALTFSSVPVRTALVAVWLIVSAGASGYFLVPPVARMLGLAPKASEDDIALRVGNVYPNLQDKFLNALQLYRTANMSTANLNTSSELALASFGSVGAQAQTVDFEAILDKRPRRTALLLFASVLGATLLVFAVFSSAMPSALYRLRHFQQSFLPPAPFALVIEPQENKILRGENAEIRVRVVPASDNTAALSASSFMPTDITLRLRERGVEKSTGQENFDSYTLRADSAGVFRYQLPALKRSVEFFAEVPWYVDFVRSETGSILVFDRPDIRSLQGSITPPSYTKVPPRTIDENSAAVMTLSGSRVELTALANKSLKAAEIVLLKRRGAATDSTAKDTVRIPMNVNDRRASGGFTVNFSGEYFIRITDTNGEYNTEPIRYSVLALQDAPPTITMLQPLTDVDLTDNALLPMKFAVADDYGFSGLKLHYRRAQSRYTPVQEKFQSMTLQLPSTLASGAEKAGEVPYVWDLNKIGIAPSDKYEFYLEVLDNDIVGGPKSAKTGILSARLPSLDEIFQEADKTQDIAAKELQKVLKEAEQMKRDMEEVSRELRKQQDKPQADWKEKKRMEEMLKKQEDFAKRTEEVRKQLEQMTEKLQQNQSISPETMKQYMEVQKLLKQVNPPELQKAAQQMQKALEQMNPEQMQQALQKFQFNEDDFKKAIERTMNILKRVQANQKTDELTKRAQELQQKQQELQKKMENTNPNDQQKRNELAQEQKQLREDTENMKRELDELEKLMKEIQEKGGRDMPMEELKKAQEALQKEQTEQAMQEAEKQMQQGNQQQAKQQQDKAKDNLQKFAQQMQQMKREMQRNVQQEAIRQMQKAMQNMLELSKRQEQLKQQSQNMDFNSAQFREAAQEQANALQDMKNVAGRMMELGQKSFAVTPEMAKELGEGLQSMEDALNNLEDRNGQQAASAQSKAMGSINRSTMQMQGAIGQMQGAGENPGGGQSGEGGEGQGQGGMSFMERMQQMATQQQAVNQQMQQALNGERMGRERGEEVGRLAAQQEAIRKSLDEMNKDQQKNGKRALGDLDRLAKEMQEIVQEMKNGNINDETLRRQERILSRLLDATRSTREQDYEKQRESRSGENVSRRTPADIDFKTQEGRMRALQELLKSGQQGYTKDYETLIRQYFEALQKTSNQ